MTFSPDSISWEPALKLLPLPVGVTVYSLNDDKEVPGNKISAEYVILLTLTYNLSLVLAPTL